MEALGVFVSCVWLLHLITAKPWTPLKENKPLTRGYKATCTNQLDIVLLIDSSGSVQEMWDKVIDNAQAFQSNFEVENNKTRIGLIDFSAVTNVYKHLDSNNTNEETYALLEELRKRHQNGRTLFEYGIGMSIEVFFSATPARVNVRKVLVVYTDAVLNENQNQILMEYGLYLRSMDIDVYIVKVNNQSVNEELKQLANKNILHVYDLDERPLDDAVCWDTLTIPTPALYTTTVHTTTALTKLTSPKLPILIPANTTASPKFTSPKPLTLIPANTTSPKPLTLIPANTTSPRPLTLIPANTTSPKLLTLIPANTTSPKPLTLIPANTTSPRPLTLIPANTTSPRPLTLIPANTTSLKPLTLIPANTTSPKITTKPTALFSTNNTEILLLPKQPITDMFVNTAANDNAEEVSNSNIEIVGDEKDSLYAHNVLRALHGAPPLEWDEELAKGAQQWARKLASENNGLRHSSMKSYSENLHMFQSCVSYIHAYRAVLEWYKRITEYNFDAPDFYWEAGTFSQVVWRSTKKLGVGIVFRHDTETTYVVARYSPWGNVHGMFKENVKPPLAGLPAKIPTLLELIPSQLHKNIFVSNDNNKNADKVTKVETS